MAQKAITIYTPASEPPHINAADDAQVHRALMGDSGIADGDDQLACAIIDNNTVRLASGTYSNQGYLVCVPGGYTEDLTVESGTQSMYRKDYVVAEFERGGGDVQDTHVFKVLRGASASSEAGAMPPALTQNDLRTGGSLRQEAIYQLLISGTTILSVTRMARLLGSFYE